MENEVKLFKEFVSRYDHSNLDILLKHKHSLRVMNVCKRIAKDLGLNDEEVKLASLIGLLHDLGRFDQIVEYPIYYDHLSFDHGALAVEILKDNDYLRSYINTNKYDDIIYKAIYNHNKPYIEDGLDEKELLFTKILRDADKIDIFNIY